MTHNKATASGTPSASLMSRCEPLLVASWDLCLPVIAAAIGACSPVSVAHERVLRTHLRAYLSGPCGWDRQSTPDLSVLLTEAAITRYLDAKPTGAKSYLARRRAALREVARALGIQPPLVKRKKAIKILPHAIALVHAPIAVAELPAVFASQTGTPLRARLPSPLDDAAAAATAPTASPGTLPSPVTRRVLVEVPNQPVKDTVTSHIDGPIRTRRTPTPPKSPSKRSITEANNQARANTIALLQGPTVSKNVATLPPELVALFDGYKPQVVCRAVWAANRDLALRLVAGCKPKTKRMVLNNCSHIAAFLHWFDSCPHRREPGVPIETIELLKPDLAEQFVQASPTWSTSTKGTVRSTLRTTLRALDANYIPQTFSYRGALAPYSPRECDIITSVASLQPTEARSRDLSFIVALALGAGLSSEDMRHLTPAHLTWHPNSSVSVTVPAPAREARRRTVPVRTSYVPLLKQANRQHTQTGRGPNHLILGVKPDRQNVTTPAITRAEISDTKSEFFIQVSRLRNTWLVATMSASVPLADLLRLAGLTSARSISDLLHYCPAPSPQQLQLALLTAPNVTITTSNTQVQS